MTQVTPVEPVTRAAFLALDAVVGPGTSADEPDDERLTGAVDIGDEVGGARLGGGARRARRRPPATSGSRARKQIAGRDSDLLGELQELDGSVIDWTHLAVHVSRRSRPVAGAWRAAPRDGSPSWARRATRTSITSLSGQSTTPRRSKIGIGDQANGPGDAFGAEPSRLSEHLLGGEGRHG